MDENLSSGALIKKRQCGPKVRTGCITCKIRHVKCDEGKPSCQRCLSTGRLCDGYVIRPRKPRQRKKRMDEFPEEMIESGSSPSHSSHSSESPEPKKDAFSIMGGSPQESRALQFFCVEAAHHVSSFVDPDFWLRVLGQLGREPPIRKSIMAVSLIYERAEAGTPTEAYANDERILSFYNSAIRSLVNPDDRVQTHVALIACVLFICLEFLRGNRHAAVLHVRSGLKLLGDLRNDPEAPSIPSFTESGTDVVEDLGLIFFRLQLQSTMFGQYSTQENVEVPEDSYQPAAELFDGLHDLGDPEFDKSRAFDMVDLSHALEPKSQVFTSLEQAKIELFLFLHNAHVLAVKAFEPKFRMGLTDDLFKEHAHIVKRFEKWRMAFFGFLKVSGSFLHPLEQTAAKVLLTYSWSSYIWVAASVEPVETAYDKFREQFKEIVSLCDQVVTSYFEGVPAESSRTLVANLSIIPPLHLTAMKCRWPDIRRDALRILNSRHWREGLFDSHRTAKCFEKVMDIEEAGIESLRNGWDSNFIPDWNDPVAESLFSQALPPERSRIHHLEFSTEEWNSDQQTIFLWSKPYGPYNKWEKDQVMIKLSKITELGATSLL